MTTSPRAHRAGSGGLLRAGLFVFALIGLALAVVVPHSAAAASHSGSRCDDVRKHPSNISPKKARRAVICLVNKNRTDRNLAELVRSNSLTDASNRHSRRMRSHNCFAHQCNGEADLAGRVARSGYLPCRCNWVLGENIAWGAGRRGSVKSLVRRWMASPGHRRNILTERFTEVGVGFLHGRPGQATHSAAMITLTLGDKN